jgi:hypothetical protein
VGKNKNVRVIITLEGGEVVNLTYDEAKELYGQLESMFGPNKVATDYFKPFNFNDYPSRQSGDMSKWPDWTIKGLPKVTLTQTAGTVYGGTTESTGNLAHYNLEDRG